MVLKWESLMYSICYYVNVLSRRNQQKIFFSRVRGIQQHHSSGATYSRKVLMEVTKMHCLNREAILFSWFFIHNNIKAFISRKNYMMLYCMISIYFSYLQESFFCFKNKLLPTLHWLKYRTLTTADSTSRKP